MVAGRGADLHRLPRREEGPGRSATRQRNGERGRVATEAKPARQRMRELAGRRAGLGRGDGCTVPRTGRHIEEHSRLPQRRHSGGHDGSSGRHDRRQADADAGHLARVRRRAGARVDAARHAGVVGFPQRFGRSAAGSLHHAGLRHPRVWRRRAGEENSVLPGEVDSRLAPDRCRPARNGPYRGEHDGPSDLGEPPLQRPQLRHPHHRAAGEARSGEAGHESG